ncbi:gliding motility lipoprotein GldD [Aureibaculum sp. 2210JD6-5]|uniref:gliding motility lipoprotein GldD n=1 Tax=Aureibaculum sp. 2210JD6-5 TaxID=3103957 RepID=UPI002AAEBEAC|nr:gliding motility lipoprotein GldD [Aureibaculum sp. 2210JD6-5]MDY7394928.1 gliding motility lipoprotein GldD [Aureibaculum sp. 2210JD6-5]
MLPQIKSIILLTLTITILTSCSNEEYLPKPKAFLRLAYSDANYKAISTDCPYEFEIPEGAQADFNERCWVNIKYPKLKASLNITYRSVENNLSELLREAEKLTYNHTIKADNIISKDYENINSKKYGALREVIGNAASLLQFHITDSTKHFITGALYFEAKPNYDSILPAVKHIEKDIEHIMETLNWN